MSLCHQQSVSEEMRQIVETMTIQLKSEVANTKYEEW